MAERDEAVLPAPERHETEDPQKKAEIALEARELGKKLRKGKPTTLRTSRPVRNQ